MATIIVMTEGEQNPAGLARKESMWPRAERAVRGWRLEPGGCTRHRAEVSDSVTRPGTDVPGLFRPVTDPLGTQRRLWAAVTRWNSPSHEGLVQGAPFWMAPLLYCSNKD